ncbi:MAG: hypothetical protein ABSE48_19140 [Verrucomicrobiota bacterium]
MAQIATTTGGKERVEIPKLWDELPVKFRYVELAPWLLVAAAILFLLEIFERRTGRVLHLFGRKSEVKEAAPKKEPVPPKFGRQEQVKETVRCSNSVSADAKPAPSAVSKPLSPSPLGTESAIGVLRERANAHIDERKRIEKIDKTPEQSCL